MEGQQDSGDDPAFFRADAGAEVESPYDIRHTILLLRKEFGITEDDLLERWDYWKSDAFMEAAWELIEALNGSPEKNRDETAIDLRRKKASPADLRAMGFAVRGG